MIPKLELPSYQITLPSGKTTKFRPFTVKEEKILLLAIEEKNPMGVYRAICDLISACTYGAEDASKIPQIDVEYLYVKIRSKSLGEDLDLVIGCSQCGQNNEVRANLDNVVVEDRGFDATKTVQLDEQCWVTMRLPTMRDTISLAMPDREAILTLDVIAGCIDRIVIDDSVYSSETFTPDDFKEWLECLTEIQRIKIINQMRKVPLLVYSDTFECKKCGHKNFFEIEGLDDFFV